MHARILPLVCKVLSDLRYSKLNEKDIEGYNTRIRQRNTGGREREGNCTVSKVKENRIFLHSSHSTFHILLIISFFSLLSVFLCTSVNIIGVNRNDSSRDRHRIGDRVHSISP